ncbi:Hsp70 protein, putative [Angomonas deanei]|uniref:Hsp70 protein, putative n=1 Tax=Angomonas deanei TaxID=59799 RepID=A0A7G2C9U8_9TRYP|nr:Hsp70 protein, putative [Angomonas deanei]
MGLKKDSPEWKEFESLLLEYSIEANERGTPVVPFGEEHAPFSSEELFAFFLDYFYRIGVNDGVVDPKNVVITVPFHATISERRSILLATHLADVSVLGFMHSTTAAAFYYGIRRRGFDKEVNIIVFDVGATHTEAGVYSLSPPGPNATFGDKLGTLKTIKVLSDKTLGGRAFDLCIAREMENEAVEKLNISRVIGKKTAAELKSQYSLLRAANKVREVLSANTQTPYTVEGISRDKDFSSTFTREQFERACGGLFDRVKALATEVIKESGIPVKKLDAFEMMGGVSRTPKIISDISAILKRDVDRTMNMDEAAAIGSAYFAVKKSVHYKSKSFRVDERVPYPVYFSLSTNTSNSSRRLLLSSDELIGQSFSITFEADTNFELDFYDSDSAPQPFLKETFSSVESLLKLYEPSVQHENNTHMVRIQMRVNSTGLPQIEEADIIFRRVENATKHGKSGNETAEPVLETRRHSFVLTSKPTWYDPAEPSKEELEKSKEKISLIETSERIKYERAHAKNDLETFIFWAKREGVLENSDVTSKITEKQLEEYAALLEKSLNWLEDGEGSYDSCTGEMYENKLSELKETLQSYLPVEEPKTNSTTQEVNSTVGEEDVDFEMGTDEPAEPDETLEGDL